MKRITTALLVTIFVFSLGALEKRPPEKINPDQLTEETLLDASRSKDHIAFVWYIPAEYWKAVISQNHEMSQLEKVRAGLVMSTLTVVAVVQGDLLRSGSVLYYDQPFLQENVKFTRIDAKEERHDLIPYKTYSGEVKKLLEAIAPALGASVGPLGDNLQFFVFNDQSDDGSRVLDPYLPGALEVELKRKSGQTLRVRQELPLDALFVPRLCPNGKPAHVSWKFCPWTGKQLPE